MNADLVFGVVALAVAAIYYALARTIPASLLDDVVGSGGLPGVYGIVLAGLALVQIARALMTSRRGESRAAQEPAPPRKVLGTLALGIGYGALLPWLGYAASIGLLLLGVLVHQGAGLNRRTVIVAACGALFLWALFVWLLGIPQPAGIWRSFLDVA